jgi:hypothetical protein
LQTLHQEFGLVSDDLAADGINCPAQLCIQDALPFFVADS